MTDKADSEPDMLTGGICIHGGRQRTTNGWRRFSPIPHMGPYIGVIGSTPAARCTRCGAVFTVSEE